MNFKSCLLLLPVAALPALGQGFTMQQALSYPYPYGLTAAAHGERVAWVFNKRGERNVWIATGPDFAAHAVTHYQGDDGMPIASLRLTPDGQTVIYARGSETNSQGEVADPTSNVTRPQQQVWAQSVAGGAPRLLGNMNCAFEGCEDIEISPDGQRALWSGAHELWIAPIAGNAPAAAVAYIRGDNREAQWSPDGKRIAFISTRGSYSLVGIYTFGDQTLTYADPAVYRDTLPRWSPDGSSLAFVRVVSPQTWAIEVWSSATGQAHAIWQSPNVPGGTYPQGEWQDDAFRFAGQRIVFASEQDGWPHLYSIPVAGGKETLLTPGQYSFVGDAVTPDASHIVFASNENDVDRRHIWQVPVAGGEAPVELTPGQGVQFTPIVTGDGKFILCLGSATATRPAMPQLIAAGAMHELASTEMPADYPSSEMVAPEDVTFHAADGLEIHGQLFMPRNRTGKGPALIFTHGGPPRQMLLGFHPMDAYNYMYAANLYLASRGYVVLSVNYRLSIMYGRAFQHPANAGARGASEYQDVVAGAKYLQSLPTVDPAKIGLWGGSYGGYLTALGLARNSDIFAAGSDYAGVHDFSALGGRVGGALGTAAQTAYSSSPVADISKWKSPVLLLQADDDRNVPFTQTVNLVPLLRQHHIPYKLIVYPDEIHDSLLWRTWLSVFTETGDFFDQVLVKGQSVQTDPPEK
jgi:dipeptidyl aminopeptidase/acylaminoacyl peptidase